MASRNRNTRRRRRTGLRVAALVCALGAIAALVLALPRHGAATASAAEPTAHTGTRTPLWSARRVPTVFQDAARAVAARATLAALRAATSSYDACVAVDERGAVSEVGGDRALAPASTMKLLTATAAIDALGADHRFTTRALLDGGDLVVVGDGDPVLATAAGIAHKRKEPRFFNAPYTSLDALADAIVASGVSKVDSVLVDDSRHDSTRYLPQWKPNYGRDGEIGALGALTVDGGFADPVAQTPAADPAILTGQRLTDALRARGVAVAGPVAHGRASADAREVGEVASPPLSAIVGEMIRGSDNYAAEQLLRAIAAASGAAPATTPAGVAVLERRLRALGVPLDDATLYDGSGLAPADRVRCSTLLAVVELAERPKFRAVDAGLAVAGRSGTLITRFLGDRLAGRLRAKTGSLAGVTALAGGNDADGGTDDAGAASFAFIANGGFSDVGGMQLQEAVAHAVAATAAAAPTAGLVPAP